MTSSILLLLLGSEHVCSSFRSGTPKEWNPDRLMAQPSEGGGDAMGAKSNIHIFLRFPDRPVPSRQARLFSNKIKDQLRRWDDPQNNSSKNKKSKIEFQGAEQAEQRARTNILSLHGNKAICMAMHAWEINTIKPTKATVKGLVNNCYSDQPWKMELELQTIQPNTLSPFCINSIQHGSSESMPFHLVKTRLKCPSKLSQLDPLLESSGLKMNPLFLTFQTSISSQLLDSLDPFSVISWHDNVDFQPSIPLSNLFSLSIMCSLDSNNESSGYKLLPNDPLDPISVKSIA